VGYSAADWSVTDTFSLAVFSKVRFFFFLRVLKKTAMKTQKSFLSLSQPPLSLNLFLSPKFKKQKTVRDPRRDEDRRLVLPGELHQRQRERREALLEEPQGERVFNCRFCF
jgi:hypothetical protein